MFGIKYATWKDVCQMYFDLSDNRKAAYLQLFPFSKLLEDDKEMLKSEDFFNRFIKIHCF